MATKQERRREGRELEGGREGKKRTGRVCCVRSKGGGEAEEERGEGRGGCEAEEQQEEEKEE